MQLALAAAVFAVFTHTRADPDLWGHVRFGQDMVAAHAIRIADRYSFASDRPWVNHEWLAEVIMYASYAAAGAIGLILLKLALLGSMLAAVIVTVRRVSMPPLMRDLLIGLAVVSTVPQANHVRPQLFSLALFAWLLASLVRAHDSRRALLMPLPIMVLWVNLHGGWIVGAGTLVVWAAAGLVSNAPKAQSKEKWLPTIVVAAAGVAATMINPYGWRLWAFLQDTVGFSRPDIVDWQPLVRLGPAYVALWGLAVCVLAAAMLRGARNRSLDIQPLAMPVLLCLASLRVNRLQSFFAIAVAMLMASQFRDQPESAEASSGGASMSRRESAMPGWPRLAAAVIVALAVLTGSIAAASRNIGCIHMDADMFPDAAVTALVEQRALHGRMLTWFDWGEYAIWHWSRQGVSVSMDGRRETVYSDATVADHLKFYFNPDERHALVQKLRPDYVWLPAKLKVAEALQQDGWSAAYSGDRSILLTRHPIVPQASTSADYSSTRCFPGP